MKMQFKIRVVFVVFCFLFLFGMIWQGKARSDTGGFYSGYKAYLIKDFKKALLYWTPLADKGNSDAQYYLGIMFFNGQGVTLDFSEAAKWFEVSARQGDVGAQYMIGEMTLKGMGVSRDYQQAGTWFKKAAIQGYPDAQLRLGEWYADSKSGNTNLILSHVWLSLASANGLQAGRERIKLIKNKLRKDEVQLANRLAKTWWELFEKE